MRTKSVSGISVHIGKNDNFRQIYSNSNFFSDTDYYLLKDDGECLTITKCRMQIPKNARKVCKPSRIRNAYYFQFESEMPLGKFEFDADESNEDVLKIYYKTN